MRPSSWVLPFMLLVMLVGGAYFYDDIFPTEGGGGFGAFGGARATFGKLTSTPNSEIYIKESRDFIFSPAKDERLLRVRDSIFVGPNSKALVDLTEAFGAGRIEIAENTIITFSGSGPSGLPTLVVAQGGVSFTPAPRAPATSLKRAARAAKRKPLLIATRDKVVIVDEALKELKVSVDESGSKMQTDAMVLVRDKLESLAQIPEAREELRALRIENPVPEVQLADLLPEPEPEPAPEPEPVPEPVVVDVVSASEEPEPAVVLPPVQAAAAAPPEAAPQAPKFRLNRKPAQAKSARPAPVPRSLVFDVETPPETEKLNVEVSVGAQMRFASGPEGEHLGDRDTVLRARGEKAVSADWNLALEGESSVATLSSDDGVKVLYYSALAEAAWKLPLDGAPLWNLSLLGGFSYRGSNGQRERSFGYSSVYGPHLGVNLDLCFNDGSRLNALSRFSLLQKDMKLVDAPNFSMNAAFAYFWPRKAYAFGIDVEPGLGLSFSSIHIRTPEGQYKFNSSGLSFFLRF